MTAFSDAEDIVGSDVLWMAIDPRGQVAAFLTAGEGPAAGGAFTGALDIFEVEDALLSLGPRGQAKLLVEAPDLSSYVALAERGLWVYDWQDVHRVRADCLDAYEIAATPTQPIFVADLPDELGRMARKAPLNIAFADTTTIPAEAVRALV